MNTIQIAQAFQAMPLGSTGPAIGETGDAVDGAEFLKLIRAALEGVEAGQQIVLSAEDTRTLAEMSGMDMSTLLSLMADAGLVAPKPDLGDDAPDAEAVLTTPTDDGSVDAQGGRDDSVPDPGTAMAGAVTEMPIPAPIAPEQAAMAGAGTVTPAIGKNGVADVGTDVDVADGAGAGAGAGADELAVAGTTASADKASRSMGDDAGLRTTTPVAAQPSAAEPAARQLASTPLAQADTRMLRSDPDIGAVARDASTDLDGVRTAATPMENAGNSRAATPEGRIPTPTGNQTTDAGGAVFKDALQTAQGDPAPVMRDPGGPAFVRAGSGIDGTLQQTPDGSRPTAMHPTSELVSVHLHRAVTTGTDRITIHLRPAELGSIEVRLEVGQDGRVQAVIMADKADTLDLLQRDARGLERALQDAGLRTDGGSLNFNLRGDGGQNRQFMASQDQSGGDASGSATRAQEDVQTIVLKPASRSDGRLDIRV